MAKAPRRRKTFLPAQLSLSHSTSLCCYVHYPAPPPPPPPRLGRGLKNPLGYFSFREDNADVPHFGLKKDHIHTHRATAPVPRIEARTILFSL